MLFSKKSTERIPFSTTTLIRKTIAPYSNTAQKTPFSRVGELNLFLKSPHDEEALRKKKFGENIIIPSNENVHVCPSSPSPSTSSESSVEDFESEEAVICSMPVQLFGSEVFLSLHDGQTVKEAAHNFCLRHDLNFEEMEKLLVEPLQDFV
eukprot:Awhi_evm1s13959